MTTPMNVNVQSASASSIASSVVPNRVVLEDGILMNGKFTPFSELNEAAKREAFIAALPDSEKLDLSSNSSASEYNGIFINGSFSSFVELRNAIQLDLSNVPSYSGPIPPPDYGQLDPTSYGVEDLIPVAGTVIDLLKLSSHGIASLAKLLKTGRDPGFRSKLITHTGVNPPKAHAHHMLSVKHADEFAKRGIDINAPEYGAWWRTDTGALSHLNNARKYEEAWTEFFIKDPSKDEIFEFGRKLAKQFGLEIYF